MDLVLLTLDIYIEMSKLSGKINLKLQGYMFLLEYYLYNLP